LRHDYPTTGANNSVVKTRQLADPLKLKNNKRVLTKLRDMSVCIRVFETIRRETAAHNARPCDCHTIGTIN